ncbi:MAG: ABC transporter substrate-binding protein, partial [Dechloromonas sp.]|nr:ABC transporter substrate-binding protein [Dechloromonas sp.]
MNKTIRLALIAAFGVAVPFAAQAQTPDVVRLGNLKFA